MRRTSRSSIFMAIVAVALTASGTRGSAAPGHQAAAPPSAANPLTNLPLTFVENRGQTDPRVRYSAQGSHVAFYLTRTEIVLAFARGNSVALQFVGGNPKVAPEGAERASGEVNYFRGSDPSRWQTRLPVYRSVVYRDLWTGIDLRLRDEAGTLKYEFRVRPGARPADIRLAYNGADGLRVDDAGALLIGSSVGVLRDSPPVSYQVVDGARVPVESRYALTSGEGAPNGFAFAVGAGYRPDRELIIDPGLAYSTLLGGTSDDVANGIKVDAAGNIYVVGTTQSSDFPTTAGAFRRSGAALGFSDVFVTKLNSTGTALVYSTFVGGGNFDWGRDIAIDAAGNAYVTGQTKSTNFPTTQNAFRRTINVDTSCPRCSIDPYDAFAFKLNASGSGLVYSTYLGGFDIDDGLGIAVDATGSAYVVGETASLNFPTTTGAFATSRSASNDAFVTKLNPSGSALVYSTYLGGTAVDFASRVAVDAAGNAFVIGSTSSPDFPTTPGAFRTAAGGAFDVFVTKLNPAGTALIYSTYLGGASFDSGYGLAIDAAGNAYVVGATGSLNFPTTAGALRSVPDGNDGFVTKLNPSGSGLVYSTMLGGTTSDNANAVTVDAAGNAWVTGTTGSVDFPTTADAFLGALRGPVDAFVSELNPTGSALLYSTLLGGTGADNGNAIALDSAGDVFVAGHTLSMDFPTTAGAVETVYAGGDAFVAKFAPGASTPPAPLPVPAAPALVTPLDGDTPAQPITFQWSGVSGAASYTIQIANSSTFVAPLVLDQPNITGTTFGATGLAATPQFWRVRGVNSAGAVGAWSAVRTFTPQPPPPPATLSTLSTNPSSVVGGSASSATAVLSVPAPIGGALVAFSSSNPAVARVPASATVLANDFTATVTITTSAVSVSTPVTITAAYNGATRTATLTVTPPAAVPTLLSVGLNPASVSGGSSSAGTVTLSAASQTGTTVSLSTNSAVVTVPGTVVVAAGATQATFTATTGPVTASTPVTVTASLGGVIQSAVLTVTPPAPPPPPASAATLTVTVSGRTGQTVTSSPAGINVAVGSTGSASFATGTVITLRLSDRTAIWTGACSSGRDTDSCTFTLKANASVSANVQ